MLISNGLNAGCDGAWALCRRITGGHVAEMPCILLLEAKASVLSSLFWTYAKVVDSSWTKGF